MIKSANKGFTILEMLIALAILSGSILIVYNTISTILRSNKTLGRIYETKLFLHQVTQDTQYFYDLTTSLKEIESYNFDSKEIQINFKKSTAKLEMQITKNNKELITNLTFNKTYINIPNSIKQIYFIEKKYKNNNSIYLNMNIELAAIGLEQIIRIPVK